MKGIDVSYAQGKMDWSKVQTDFVIIKANTGVNATDPQLFNNANGAFSRGIPVGYYHWGTFNRRDVVEDAREEALEFIGLLNRLPKYTITPALDVEEERVKDLSPEEVQMWILSYVSEMKKAGHDTMIYSYSHWLNAYLPKNHVLGHLPLWIAGYPWDLRPDQSPKYPTNVPTIPEDESEIRKRMVPLPRGFNKADYWQYSGMGRHNGISGFVDLNIKL